jgi:hypothetical protein
MLPFGCGRLLIPLALLAAAAGCSKKSAPQLPVHPVTGQVVVNGQPAAGAMVVFHPKDQAAGLPTPNAVVDKQGNYTLSTYAASDGAPAGEYVVTVVWRLMVQKNGEFEPGPNLLPPAVSKPTSSKIAARVAEGANTVPIKLTR